MTRLIFVDVDDTLLTPPYDAVRRVASFFGTKFPDRESFLRRSHVEYHKAFPDLFRSSAHMWALAVMSLPFGHFRSQSTMPFDVEQMASLLADHRLYLLSKNPPSFTRWRVQRLEQLFGVRLGDRYIACGPMLRKGATKLSIMQQVAAERGVALENCLLVDDSAENVEEAAAAGAACALVRASWNEGRVEPMRRAVPNLPVIDTTAIAATIAAHLQGPVQADGPTSFLVPPLTPLNATRLTWTFLKRRWLYGEPLPRLKQVVPVARSPLTSLLYRDPHAATCRRMRALLDDSSALVGLRVLPLKRDARPMRLPLSLRAQLQGQPADGQVRALRTAARELLRSRGHTFVRDAMFYFTELNRAAEKERILRSPRLAHAKQSYSKTHNEGPQKAEDLAEAYVEELLTCRSYRSCIAGEWVVDTVLGKILEAVHLQPHPEVRALESDHFLLYAATHRSYLDSAVLWSLLSHQGQSFPFAVGADKMRTVWFGRLGTVGGSFFFNRRFVDAIYAAIIAEHVSTMQRPGSVLEVFLEGQRSRSGLTLPPKKGIASIVWENMAPGDKVAIVPVSFTYNKIPESEKLIKERYDEREKQGALTLRERADMRVRQGARKSRYERLRATWRRLRSPKVSSCYVHYAQPIVLHKSDDKAVLQQSLNEAMLRINSAAAILPSSVLCLHLLAAEDGHATAAEATDFLRFSAAMLALYRLPAHLASNFLSDHAEADVRAFVRMPFVNRKFKRAGVHEEDILCIDGLDIDRATYYKNNVLHFFALPAILSYVLTDVRQGRVEELHRCFDHMFTKLQTTYFLPQVDSVPAFINALLQLLAERGSIVLLGQTWAVEDRPGEASLLRVMSRIGAELVQQDLPSLLTAIRRSSDRTEVQLPSQIISEHVTAPVLATAAWHSAETFFLHGEADAQPGDQVAFTPLGDGVPLHGRVTGVELDGVAVRREAEPAASGDAHAAGGGSAPNAQATGAQTSQLWRGSVVFRRRHIDEGTITDLSPSGAFVATAMQVPAGSQLTCTLQVEGVALELPARVMRVTEAGLGVRFEQLNEATKVRLVLLNRRPAS